MTLFSIATPFALVGGWFTWTLGEYLLHRFGMHEAKGKGLASREHLKHHADRDSVLEKWALSWTGIILFGIAFGFFVTPAFGVGWVVGYAFYDWQHYWAHRRAPRNRYERWLRRHHFHHHFGHPTMNHGVTTPVWDLVFGTYERVEGPVKVPRRLAMRWLVDDDGELLPGYEHDWELVGRKLDAGEDPRQDEIDRARAFANLAPTP